jgi:hypothetical protein
MKKILSFFIFFLGGSILLFLFSIAGCTLKKDLYAYKDVKVVVYKTDSIQRQIASGDTCAFDACFFQLRFETNNLTSAFVPGFGNKVYAQKLQEPEYKCVETISNIKIITLRDYNTHFPAGADITAASIDEAAIIKAINKAATVYSKFPAVVFNFKLKERPAQVSAQQFAIEIRTAQNTVLRDTSVVFILQP